MNAYIGQEVKMSMENEKQDKLITIKEEKGQNNQVRYYCKVNIPPHTLVKFSFPRLEPLINTLGHILIALTPKQEGR